MNSAPRKKRYPIENGCGIGSIELTEIKSGMTGKNQAIMDAGSSPA